MTIGAISSSQNSNVLLANQIVQKAQERASRSQAATTPLVVPRLERVGQRETTIFYVTDESGRVNDVAAEFQKISDTIVRVNISGDDRVRDGVQSYDIHLFSNGRIIGFDTDGSGRVNAIEPPGVQIFGSDVNLRLAFDDTRLAALDFKPISIPFFLLEFLQSPGSLQALIQGTAGDDVLAGVAGPNIIDGLAGTDTVDYSADTAAVTVNLETQTATDGSGSADTLVSIENATGSGFNDSLTGSTGDNVLNGGAGNDTIDDGGGGTDALTGGTGIDTFVVHDATGTTTISDFDVANEFIDLSDVASITNFGQASAAATDDGSGNVDIDLGGGSTLTLTGVTTAELSNANFIF